MRLIDADALKSNLGLSNNCETCKIGITKNCQLETFIVYGICAMLDDAPTVNGWISVKDKLPEKQGEYIAFDGKSVFGAYYERGTSGTKWTDTTEGCWDFEVTHWMPLPEPPKENV